MPSKNSINKPKHTEAVRHRNHVLAKKRNDRERRGLINPPRSHEDSKSGKAKSESVDLYLKGNNLEGDVITRKTLSKKRQKKIERNMRYAEKRKLLTDVQAKLEEDTDMEATEETNSKSPIKDVFWSALEDAESTVNICQEGEGTTLGGPFFP